jgi:dipicolinate synthase subunit B
MKKKPVGFAVCGSFCTYWDIIPLLHELKETYDLFPVASEAVCTVDTRFGKAADFMSEFEKACGKKAITSIAQAEPIGPKGLFDLLIVAPCTGNTLGKLACGITDSTVTMACKAHLRNARPLLIAVSTNDGLGGNAENIGRLLQRKNIYFVPFGQDGPDTKQNSLQSDFSLLKPAAEAALEGRQLQPVLLGSV